MLSLQEIVGKITRLILGQDNMYVQADEAIAAAVAELEKTEVADASVTSEQDAISHFRTLAIGYGAESTDADLAALLAAGQQVAFTRGERIVKVADKVAAIETAIREKAEATMAKAEAEALLTEIQGDIAGFSL